MGAGQWSSQSPDPAVIGSCLWTRTTASNRARRAIQARARCGIGLWNTESPASTMTPNSSCTTRSFAARTTYARSAGEGSALGVDLSASMIERARELARAERVHNVAFEQGDAQVHRFPEDGFHLAIS